ncbi:MAG TPA: SDR family NAD(P)-dependent oxidoreductase [Chloroflexota bacterium]|nr:SDR family NAD(P)-dependent oxidoreductase [Chloroflexota bacterium]
MDQQPVAIVTGASSGIGEATARLFAERGYRVVLAARSAERLEKLAAEIAAAGGAAMAVPTDVTDQAAVEALANKAIERFGRIDVLVNNAGRGFQGTIAGMKIGDFEGLVRLNVVAPVMCLQAVVPRMRRQGGGVIVNVSSVVESMAMPFSAPYPMSKIALSYLSDAARIELSRDNIAVVNVLPGSTQSEFGRNVLRSGDDPSVDLNALPRDSGPSGVPASAVAEAIWRAVQQRPRRLVVGRANQVAVMLLPLLRGPLNAAMIGVSNRYIPRPGQAARRPMDDARLAGALAAAVAAVTITGTLLTRRGQ